MSTEEKHSQLGKSLVEINEQKRHLACLKKKSKDIAESLRNAAYYFADGSLAPNG